MIEFSIVPETEARDAHNWHLAAIEQFPYLFPRTWDDYRTFTRFGQLWCARDSAGNYLGLSHYGQNTDQKTNQWEIGGVTVSPDERHSGIGKALSWLALCQLLVKEKPFLNGKQIVGRIHPDNRAGRHMVNQLSFQHIATIRMPVPSDAQTSGRNTAYMDGEEYQVSNPETLITLANWCNDWNGQLDDGRCATIILGSGETMKDWAAALRNMAQQMGEPLEDAS